MCTCFDFCVPVKYWYNEINHDFSSDSKKLMQSEADTDWFKEQFSTFNDFVQPIFAEIRTKFAMGYTFNIIDADKLLNFKS